MSQGKPFSQERTPDEQQTQQDALWAKQKAEMFSRLSLAALLSQVLIAFTLDFDSEFKRETADAHLSPPSLAMWSNVMRFLDDKEGLDEYQLPVLSGIPKEIVHSMVACLERHGWVSVELASTDSRARLIRLTQRGQECQELWQPLLGVIEQRWQARFGKNEINTLRKSLEVFASQLDVELAHYPMFGANTAWRTYLEPDRSSFGTTPRLPLFALLSQTLIAFTVEFEGRIEDAKNSSDFLALYSNVTRFLGAEGLPSRQLPVLSGIWKPVISILVNKLERLHWVVVETDSTNSRTKLIRLTQVGRNMHDACQRLLTDVEQDWEARFGEDKIHALRKSLEAVVRQFDAELPHYPVPIAHRGGTPTGR